MKTPIKNLSRKSTEARTERILRINADRPRFAPLQAKSDRTIPEIRGKDAYTKREREPGEATGLTMPIWAVNKGRYRSGDGDNCNLYVPRIGSDHSALKSHGSPT